CALAVTVRWAGAIGLLLVIAALLSGEWRDKSRRVWLAAALCVVVTTATFFTLRHAFSVTPEEAQAAKEFGGAAEDTGAPAVAITDKQVASQYKLITETAGTDGYGQRLINWGRWFAFLYWQPFR